MPIYEEKLISPLAIRFTQDHIRTTFRDARCVDAAIDEIETMPGIDGYDLILKVPFPNIEILRWCIPRESADIEAETNCPSGVRPREHWFTLDNRRLYCLQSAAVKHWPAKVAAVVEILYADSGSVRKKFDSIDCGWSVNVGHSYEDPPLFRWDWKQKVEPLEVDGESVPVARLLQASAATEPTGVLALLLLEDRKRMVSQLLDAPARPSSLVAQISQGPISAGSASSNAGPLASELPFTRFSPEASEARRSEAAKQLVDNYDPVVANAVREIKEQLNKESDGCVNLPHWEDRYEKTLGPLRQFIASRPDKFTIVPEADGSFKVVKTRRRDKHKSSDESSTNTLAAHAVAELEEQLSKPGHDGRLNVARWNEAYEESLGPLRSFVKNLPEKFTVIPGEGRHFRVVKKADGLGMYALREIEEQLDRQAIHSRFQVPQWSERYEPTLGPLRAFLANYPEKFAVRDFADGDISVLRTRDLLAQRAIAEVETQLVGTGHPIRLHMPHWNDTFAATLGTLRGFLESRPDKFSVTLWQERQFLVSRCSDDFTQQALREIMKQVNDPRFDGRIRVPQWNERFRDRLGPMRAFLEKWPDMMRVIPGDGGKFFVESVVVMQ